MTDDRSLVSVLIPARNEAADIEACLAAIAGQDIPRSRLEVVVVDGCSDDGTGDLARAALERWRFGACEVVDNPRATTPSNLNLGLARLTGSVVCRVDARTRIEPHYVRTCAATLAEHPEIAVVGGAQIASPRDGSSKAGGIARALNNRLSMGGSPYRRSRLSRESDTVYLGAFRRADLLAAGGWNEDLPTNQDFDLNRRMSELGLVWFDASLRSAYVPRASLAELARQYHRFGRWKVRYWRRTGSRPGARQAVLIGAPVVAAVAGVAVAGARPGRVAFLGVAACAGLAAVDRLGHDDRATLGTTAWASVATSVVSLAWWTGVVREGAATLQGSTR